MLAIKNLFKKNKNGFTLVELCIVIALIAIVVSLVVVFSMLMSGKASQAEMRKSVVNDISDLESHIKQWIKHYDNCDYRFGVDAGTHGADTVLIVYNTLGTDKTSDDTPAGRLELSSDLKKLNCEGVNDFDVKYIKNIVFSITEGTSGGSGHSLITCDVVYRDGSSKDENATNTTRLIFSTHAGAEIKR